MPRGHALIRDPAGIPDGRYRLRIRAPTGRHKKGRQKWRSPKRPNGYLLVLDDALRKFSELEERKGQLVKLRYFVGLSSAEAAEVLGISKATADRDWAYARAWLHSEVRSEE